IGDEKSVELDLNGHELEVEADQEGVAGIGVPEGTALTITDTSTDQTGKLIARSEENGAGIGSGHGDDSGDITIKGGTIEAVSEEDSAAIGSGHAGDNGTITIEGGNITATSQEDSAAIGSGDAGDAGDITIKAETSPPPAKEMGPASVTGFLVTKTVAAF